MKPPRSWDVVGGGAVTGLGNHLFRVDPDGRFDIGPFAVDPGAGLPAEMATAWRGSASSVTFTHEGLAPLLLDPRSVPEAEHGRVVVTMTEGVTLAGTVVGIAGHPLAGVPVVVEYGDVFDLRRGVRTDAQGAWRLERLTPGPAALVARAFAYDAKVRRELTLVRDDLDVRLVAEPIRLSRVPTTTKVLGLGLVDVDDELRAAYEVPEYVKVLILDPGENPESLGIGRLARGYGLWHVGNKAVSSLAEALDLLIDPTSSKGVSFGGGQRVVYTFWSETRSGTNTQHLRMTEAQITDLKAVRERLGR